MAYTPVTFQHWGGLNLAVDAFEVGASGATSCSNVDIDRGGQIMTRPGLSTSFSSDACDTLDGFAAFEKTNGTRQFLIGYTESGTEQYAAYASTGGAAVATAGPTNARISPARWGDPTNEYLYIANGADTIWRWTGAAFSQPAGMPIATHLAVTLLSNRLVAANITGTSVSQVAFSDEGAPETWDANNDLELAPGDGSEITGLASWQESVFAFKRERFFVFYGESTDADGEPVFNYRPVDGYGSLVAPAAGDEGVYFYDGRTIWLTTGGTPQRVSAAIEPFLRSEQGSGSTINLNEVQFIRLHYALGKLYVSFPTSGGADMLVLDPKTGAWTFYTYAVDELPWIIELRSASSEVPYVYTAFTTAGTAFVRRYDEDLEEDGSTAIAWNYQTGKYALGDPGESVIVPETSVVGSGTVAVSIDSELYTQGSTVTLGPLDVTEAWVASADQEGRWLQTTFSGSSDARAVITQLKHYVSSKKPVGVQ